MSNTTTGAWETEIADRAQLFLDKKPLYRQLANFRMQGIMKRGREVNRPIFTPGQLSFEDYTPNAAITATDWTYTQEKMTVNVEKACRLKTDPFEELDLQIAGHRALLADRLIQAGERTLDQAFLAEVSNAALDVDDSDFGGTASDPINLTTNPVEDVWGQAFAELTHNVGEGERLYTVIDAFQLEKIANRAIEATYQLSDKYFEKYVGKTFKGFDLYLSNNLPTSFTLTYTGTGTNAVDFRIGGITFHQVTTIGSTAGNVLMATNATTCATNVKNFLNAPGTTSANQVALSSANQDRLRNAGVVATSAAGVVTVTGYGRLQPKYVTTDTNASFSDESISTLCGVYKNIDMVVQMAPTVKIRGHDDNIGESFMGTIRAAIKTYADGAQRTLKILTQ